MTPDELAQLTASMEEGAANASSPPRLVENFGDDGAGDASPDPVRDMLASAAEEGGLKIDELQAPAPAAKQVADTSDRTGAPANLDSGMVASFANLVTEMRAQMQADRNAAQQMQFALLQRIEAMNAPKPEPEAPEPDPAVDAQGWIAWNKLQHAKLRNEVANLRSAVASGFAQHQQNLQAVQQTTSQQMIEARIDADLNVAVNAALAGTEAATDPAAREMLLAAIASDPKLNSGSTRQDFMVAAQRFAKPFKTAQRPAPIRSSGSAAFAVASRPVSDKSIESILNNSTSKNALFTGLAQELMARG